MTILRLVGIVFLSLVGAYLLLVLHVMVAAYLTDRRMRDAWVHADKDYRHTP